MIRGLDIRSSWTVDEHGIVTRFGDKPRKLYSCTGCGALGHSVRTCGREPVR